MKTGEKEKLFKMQFKPMAVLDFIGFNEDKQMNIYDLSQSLSLNKYLQFKPIAFVALSFSMPGDGRTMF